MNAQDSTFPQPVLLIGYDGMLGQAWGQLLAKLGVANAQPTLEELDLTRRETLAPIAEGRWRLVINCAAYTDVDGAESEEDLATRINATGVGALAEACEAGGALLVHYSTDYVFDGSAQEPYPVDQTRQPLGAYGRSKAKGEELIERSGCEHLIIRTSWLYGPWGKNFVLTIRNLLRERENLRVVDDQRGRPTSVLHLAQLSWSLIEHGSRGLWHGTDGGECTWFEFAKEIAAHTPGACPVEPCATDEFPRPAPRPAFSVLDLTQTESLLGAMPDWRENLDQVLKRVNQDQGLGIGATN